MLYPGTAGVRPTVEGVDRVDQEPCVSCGEETAVGSVFYSDRYALHDDVGEPAYVCSLCLSRAHAVRGKKLTKEQVRNFVNNGAMAAISWANRGG